MIFKQSIPLKLTMAADQQTLNEHEECVCIAEQLWDAVLSLFLGLALVNINLIIFMHTSHTGGPLVLEQVVKNNTASSVSEIRETSRSC